ncbi:DUF1427 family protein [Paraburkholderia caballeronis]|uniref:XapX domain-containing protein n=1 Tax=Paraburkholderia caballeronis TaxID=416943 RepID=A0A1H7L708_9BURK|nr:DUF1427 family protein [Paraburkholderia caballeronis]PXW28296.1 XapX domain-containing protein [Paraburkholderia caballeronis]PXX03662.1 XapX domain-containing protein [Paraburkholderia caballeronis]RAK04406.1 XapX domain-containing protein [Paraburkholderia caballeronis]SED81445.1 XapX domain-containing protein [Paraburkholderia caballeronis]SEK94057.1 XapX domain-containing protein [Paraburkholderia caballeronis]
MSYLISLGVGFGIGLIYWLVRVQSPAPPLIALAGLLGIVLGEHAIPVARDYLHPAQNVAGRAASDAEAAAPASDAHGSSK